MRRTLGLAAALLLIAQVAVSCASAAVSPAAQPTTASQRSATGISQLVSAEELAKELGRKAFVLVDVHTPYAGEIDGTDLFIPYDQIAANLAKLPQEKGAKIVLYCRSGAMSAIAAKTLVAAGYTNVLELKGGMEAWRDAGYQIVERSR